MTKEMTPSGNLLITEVRIEGFRLLRDLWVPLRPLTVILGENNSGKTAFLDALGVAFGNRSFDDDLFQGADGDGGKPFVVDLKLQPVGNVEFDDEVRALVGEAIQIPYDSTEAEFFAIRTVGTHDVRRGNVSIRRCFLRKWVRHKKDTSATQELKKPGVSRDVLDLLSFHCLDARRDILEQLRGRTTYWGRLAADLGIEAELRAEIEGELLDLSKRILKGSDVLGEIEAELGRITEALRPGASEVSVSPLPSKVHDLIRGMDILVARRAVRPSPWRVREWGRGASRLSCSSTRS